MPKRYSNVKIPYGYQLKNNYKSRGGRNYAVVYRPTANDYVVANGFNFEDGSWGQGYYGYRSRKRAKRDAKYNSKKWYY